MIRIITGFDGACPHEDKGVRREGPSSFVLFPGLRRKKGISEERTGYGSRLSTRLLNEGRTKAEALVVVDWEGPERVLEHDLGFLRHDSEKEWRMIPGVRSGKHRIEYCLELDPGTTRLGLYPEYNWADCCAFVEDSRRKGIAVESAGRSREGRDIWLLSLPALGAGDDPAGKKKRAGVFFLQARVHAYETAGSWCVEGVRDFLLSSSPLAEYLRSKFDFHIMPMANPDGVYNGLSRLTWERGADLGLVNGPAEPARDALRNTLDRLRPDVFLTIHNWTQKFIDGLLPNDLSFAERVMSHMPADAEHHKRWSVRDPDRLLKLIGWSDNPGPEARRMYRKYYSFRRNYCPEKFGSIGLAFEFPWFGLATSDMQEKGARALAAVALAAIEERKL